MNLELDLLTAWMMMSQNIKANRLLDQLSENEMFILSFLYANKKASAKDITSKTNMLKSQINRHLNELQKKGFILSKQDDDDKRKISISLTKKGEEIYLKEHDRIIELINFITSHLGTNKTLKLTQYVKEAVEALKDYEH